ncbi:MAG: rubrerythrin family protein [Chloroflexi bacterium]|nr:rubrerythrin family protein [Chloroflexota bacterium]
MSDIRQVQTNWQDEIDSAAIYRALAAKEAQTPLAEVYRRLAVVEEKHAAFWEDKLRAAGQTVPPRTPTWRARTMAWLAQRFGASFILPTLTDLESADSGSYDQQPDAKAAAMPAEERSHERLLKTITGRSGMSGSTVARLEGRHRAVAGNALRAAVLGANDGLLSNFSLIMGVAGAEQSGHTILIAGLAGLMAGAGSMALGEWISVQSSRELYHHQIGIEQRELEDIPAEEEEELKLIYQSKGLSEDAAGKLAHELISEPSTALDTLSREELGIDPDELGGSAWEAGITSFFLFAVGAIIPIAPFALLNGNWAVIASVILSGAALFGIGALITLMTGRSVLYSGGRQLIFGLIAAALTFGIGKIVGVAVGG